MKRILPFAALAFTACDSDVTREAPATPAPKRSAEFVPPTPIPNKLKGTTLDRPIKLPRGKRPPEGEPAYINPLEQKPK